MRGSKPNFLFCSAEDVLTCEPHKTSAGTSGMRSFVPPQSNMPPEDRVRLLHMIEAAEAVANFVAGRKRDDLDSNDMLMFALARAIEILGEAASRLTPEMRSANSAVPWAQISAMRNRLVHAYFDIDHDILWSTATIEVPSLLPILRSLLGDPIRNGGT